MKVWNKAIYLLLGLILVFSAVNANATEYSDYVTSPPIIINGNSDFANYNIPGTGTKDDPYVIENFNITGNGVYGIYITGVSVYVVIRNCFIKGFDAGIIITEVSSPLVVIEDNVIQASTYGIGVSKSYKMAYIFRNEVKSGVYGIVASDTATAIVNNTIYSSNFGLDLVTISRGLILNNSMEVSQWGMSIDAEVTNTEICWNKITGFSEVAIGIDGETGDENITIHHNIAILKQSDGVFKSLGVQYEANNKIYWYDRNTNEGNYWSDWTGTGSYPIVDINGNKVNEDPYPLSSIPVPTSRFPEIPTPIQETTSSSNSNVTPSLGETITSNFTNPLAINVSSILVTIAVLGIGGYLIKRRRR